MVNKWPNEQQQSYQKRSEKKLRIHGRGMDAESFPSLYREKKKGGASV